MEASFDDAIALRRLGNGRFAASTPPSWSAPGPTSTSGRCPTGRSCANPARCSPCWIEPAGGSPRMYPPDSGQAVPKVNTPGACHKGISDTGELVSRIRSMLGVWVHLLGRGGHSALGRAIDYETRLWRPALRFGFSTGHRHERDGPRPSSPAGEVPPVTNLMARATSVLIMCDRRSGMRIEDDPTPGRRPRSTP